MPAGFLRRTRSDEPQLAAPTAADDVLGRLLDRDRIIDRFDADYLDDLPVLLRELHEVTEDNARDHERWDDLRALWTLGGRPEEEFSIAGLANAAYSGRRPSPLDALQNPKAREAPEVHEGAQLERGRRHQARGRFAQRGRGRDRQQAAERLLTRRPRWQVRAAVRRAMAARNGRPVVVPHQAVCVEQSVPARRRAAPHDRPTLGRRDPLLPPGPRPRANDRP